MDTTERYYKIDQTLRNRGVVSARDFLAVLEVSPATFKRDLQYLRDRLYAPIIWDQEKRGYRFTDPAAPRRFRSVCGWPWRCIAPVKLDRRHV